MNNKGQSLLIGSSLLIVLFLLIVTAFAFIEPLKESLDNIRGSTALNCPGTPNHNSTAYVEDTSFQKLVRRPTCAVTGFSMVWFIGAFLVAAFVWVSRNWRRTK